MSSFLCPPPTTHLIGGSWWTQQASDHENSPDSPPSVTVSAPNMTVCISGESTSQKGNLEWHAPNGSVMDSSSVITTPNDPVVSGKCVSKQLYINDADEKRKRVECLVKIQLANGFNLGTLASKGIKVISKPSKKRQSVKNMERKWLFVTLSSLVIPSRVYLTVYGCLTPYFFQLSMHTSWHNHIFI